MTGGYCPNCSRALDAVAPQCPFCGADFTASGGWRPGPRVEHDLTWSWLAAGAVFAPFGACIATFFLLCLIECTVYPWFTLFVAPVVTVVVWVILFLKYLRWRKSNAAQDAA
jgi:hypothetical protein